MTMMESQFVRTPRAWVPILTSLLLLVAAAPSRAQARFEVVNYTIDAELFPSTHVLTAKAKIDFLPSADLTTISFELHSNLRVETLQDASGKPLAFRRDGLNLTVDFINPQISGKLSSITVQYGGLLVSAEGSPVENIKLAYIGPEGSYLLYPARWFPVNGYGVNRFAATMRIAVPSDDMVVASGKALSPVRHTGKVTYIYESSERSFPGTVL